MSTSMTQSMWRRPEPTPTTRTIEAACPTLRCQRRNPDTPEGPVPYARRPGPLCAETQYTETQDEDFVTYTPSPGWPSISFSAFNKSSAVRKVPYETS